MALEQFSQRASGAAGNISPLFLNICSILNGSFPPTLLFSPPGRILVARTRLGASYAALEGVLQPRGHHVFFRDHRGNVRGEQQVLP